MEGPVDDVESSALWLETARCSERRVTGDMGGADKRTTTFGDGTSGTSGHFLEAKIRLVYAIVGIAVLGLVGALFLFRLNDSRPVASAPLMPVASTKTPIVSTLPSAPLPVPAFVPTVAPVAPDVPSPRVPTNPTRASRTRIPASGTLDLPVILDPVQRRAASAPMKTNPFVDKVDLNRTQPGRS